MSQNEPGRDWFAPPPGQPDSEPAAPARPVRPPQPPRPRPRRRRTFPDQRVWPPPAPAESVEGATQPFPALPGTRPLPPRAPNPTGGVADPPPRRPRTLLMGVAAVVALVLAAGAPTVDAYLFYRGGQPSDIVHTVAAGKEKTFEHVSWQAAIEAMKAPQPTPPGRQWMKIVVTRKGVDATGIRLTGRPELELRDRAGRAWAVEITEDDVAIDDAVVGKPYTYTAHAVVPEGVAGEVELRLRPDTTYRSDTPTDQLLAVPTDPAEREKAKHKDVLVFRR